MSKLFFTADFHFNHKNIMKYCDRPFSSTEEMDNHLIDNINSIVGKDDELWFLGDFCFAPKNNYFEMSKLYRDRINCRKINCAWGNHDHHSIHSLFNITTDLRKISCSGQEIVLCHYALAIWEKSHHGAWMLYGHSHSNAEANLDAMMPGRRSFDVGVDNAKKILGAYRPWSFDEIKAIMDQRKGVSVDHHGSR